LNVFEKLTRACFPQIALETILLPILKRNGFFALLTLGLLCARSQFAGFKKLGVIKSLYDNNANKTEQQATKNAITIKGGFPKGTIETQEQLFYIGPCF
jgi:hypothetical protein